MTTAAPPTAPLLEHEALVYSTPEELVSVSGPFVREGVDRGEGALVITTRLNAGALRAALSDAAQSVDWEDSAVWYPRPVDRLQALERYARAQLDRGVRRVRMVSESAWPGDSTAAASELKRFESVLNLLFAGLPVWMGCPYDASVFNHILPDAYRTHPVIRDARVTRQASAAYLEPAEFFRALDSEQELPPAPPDARVLRLGSAEGVRSFVVAEASAAGLSADRMRDLGLAAVEMATNAIRYGGAGELRVWVAQGELVCEVRDTGGGMRDRLAGYRAPSDPALGGWGLLLARRLCDGVEVRSSPAGTVVRLSMRLPGAAHPR